MIRRSRSAPSRSCSSPRRSSYSILLALALLVPLVACGDAPPTVEPQSLVVPAAADARAIDAAASPSSDPRCDEPCLFLQTAPLDGLSETYRTTCAKPLLPDNADCGKLDYWRNCVYAAHGYRFKKAKWKIYSTKPWYKPRPEFVNAELSMLERANVHELRLRARACRHNDVHVSTADFARIQAWFKTTPIPAIAVSGDDLVKPAELGATLSSLKLALGKDTWMAYHDPDRAVAAALPNKKLRDAIVDFSPRDCSDDECDGPFLHFVFDEHDALVALVLTDH